MLKQRNLPRYSVPLLFKPIANGGKGDFIAPLPSFRRVIPFDWRGHVEFEVALVPPSKWKPEKTPRYEVSRMSSGRGYLETRFFEETRLSKIPISGPFVVEQVTRGKHNCIVFEKTGIWHIMRACSGSCDTEFMVCGETAYPAIATTPKAMAWREPTCPRCLAAERFWGCYLVAPHAPPDATRKLKHKVKAKEQAYLRMPSAMERLVDGTLFEGSDLHEPSLVEIPPEKEPPVFPLLEPGDEYACFETDEREARLASARDRNLRFKATTGKRRLRKRPRNSGVKIMRVCAGKMA